ncbi:MAG: tetratricopeptide repeat protein, partial [Acidobacteria bacterium]
MLRRLALLAACCFVFSTVQSHGAAQHAGGNPQKQELDERLQTGASHLQRGESEAAIRELKRALALDPRSAAAHLLLGQAYLGMRSVSLVAEAKAEFQQALDLDPTLLWAHFYLAKVYIDQGRYDRAKEELESGLQQRPNVPHFLSLLGETNRKMGHAEAAIELNQQALKADPNMTPAYYYIGLAYMDLKKEDEAIAALESSIASPHVAPEMYLTLGSLYARKKRYQEGEELCKKAVALDPSRPEAHVNLAQMYNIRGASDLALQELKLALDGKSFPTSPYYQQLQADAFFETGRAYQAKQKPTEALRAYRTALELNPGEARTHRQLAELYVRTGDYI